MNVSIGVLGTANAGFLALVVVGGLAGWIAGAITDTRQWLFGNMVIGVAGSWIGAQIADLLGIVAVGSIGHFVAALIGSIIIITIWRRLYPGRAVPPPARTAP